MMNPILFERVQHCLGAPSHWRPRTNCSCCPPLLAALFIQPIRCSIGEWLLMGLFLDSMITCCGMYQVLGIYWWRHSVLMYLYAVSSLCCHNKTPMQVLLGEPQCSGISHLVGTPWTWQQPQTWRRKKSFGRCTFPLHPPPAVWIS